MARWRGVYLGAYRTVYPVGIRNTLRIILYVSLDYLRWSQRGVDVSTKRASMHIYSYSSTILLRTHPYCRTFFSILHSGVLISSGKHSYTGGHLQIFHNSVKMTRRRSKRKATVLGGLTKAHGGLRRSKRKLAMKEDESKIYGNDFGILPSD